jgi:hypothetical protein
MRTTVRIQDELLAEAKQAAVRTHRTLTAVIEDALKLSISVQGKAERREPVRLHTVGGRGLRPGVDLDDAASLLDLMEAPNDPA